MPILNLFRIVAMMEGVECTVRIVGKWEDLKSKFYILFETWNIWHEITRNSTCTHHIKAYTRRHFHSKIVDITQNSIYAHPKKEYMEKTSPQ